MWLSIDRVLVVIADTLDYWSVVLTWLIGFEYLIAYLSGQSLMNPFDIKLSDTPINPINCGLKTGNTSASEKSAANHANQLEKHHTAC